MGQEAKNNPHQINRDSPAFQAAEEFPCSTWNGFNEGWGQMTRGWSMSYHGWTKQRGNGLCFTGQVLAPLASEVAVQCWWDHTEKSLQIEFRHCFFCDREEVRAREVRALLLGSPWPPHKLCLAQARMEQGMAQRAKGEMEKSSHVRLGPC